MNWTLGVDTSSVDLGIGLYHNNEPVASYSRFVRNSHAEHISNAVSLLLSANSVKPSSIHHVAVSVGPGSFTGLRIGLSFVKGFCFGRTAHILPVSSLEILSYTAINHNGRVIAVIDARNNDVYFAAFNAQNGIISRLSEDKVDTIDNFKQFISEFDIIVTDTMGYAKSTVFSSFSNQQKVLPVEKYHVQRGLYCAAVGAVNIDNKELWSGDTATILPNYIRGFTSHKSSKVTT